MMHSEDMQLQLLYEYWLKRDTWSLRDEALPLLLGRDPERADPATAELQALWQRLQSAVEAGELTIYNRQGPEQTWAVAPATLYRWAGQNDLAVPEPFSALMEFILQTVKRDVSAQPAEGEGLNFNAENEAILGAAFAVLAAFPKECRKRWGGIDLRRIIILMNEHAGTLFGTRELAYSYERIYDLLKTWRRKLDGWK